MVDLKRLETKKNKKRKRVIKELEKEAYFLKKCAGKHIVGFRQFIQPEKDTDDFCFMVMDRADGSLRGYMKEVHNAKVESGTASPDSPTSWVSEREMVEIQRQLFLG